jgi:hypothetical protein
VRDRAAVADAIRGFHAAPSGNACCKAAYSYAVIAAGVDADDLIQEAMTLALSGDRPWPADVPIMAFLIQCMRSIASGEKESQEAAADAARWAQYRLRGHGRALGPGAPTRKSRSSPLRMTTPARQGSSRFSGRHRGTGNC